MPTPRMRTVALAAGLASLTFAGAAEPPRLSEEARSALVRATDYLRSIATEGGYLWRYAHDLSERAGEELATPTQVWVQPPGTPAVGQAFLRAHEVTGDGRFLAAARDAAWALVRGQLRSGGWDYLIEFDPAKRGQWDYRVDAPGEAGTPRKNISTYDDDNTQSALRFLLAFLDVARTAPDPRDAQIREACEYGLRKLLEAQYSNGAWPQRWDGSRRDPAEHPVLPARIPDDYPREQPSTGYFQHYTLNDDTQRDIIRTLMDAHRRTGRPEYQAAVRRGADFLLLAQLPAPQPGWAQQYNAAMEPAWARAFEPPGVTSRESASAVRLLVDLYLELGDAKYIRRVPEAIAWFRRSELAPGRWARLYELHTNRPIYGDRDKRIHYTLAELSEERRTGYAWEGAFDIPATLEYAEGVLQAGREQWRATAAARTSRPAGEAQRLEPRVRAVITALDPAGRWLVDRGGKFVDPARGPWVQMAVFEANLRLLCDYLATPGG